MIGGLEFLGEAGRKGGPIRRVENEKRIPVFVGIVLF